MPIIAMEITNESAITRSTGETCSKKKATAWK